MSDEEEHARVLSDLAATTITRVRKTVGLATQLLDDDEDIAFILMFVAADLLVGSAIHLHASDEDMTKDKALGVTLKAFLSTVGIEEIKAAILATPEKKQCGA